MNRFRTRHTEALRELFVQVVEVAQGLGLANLGHVATDSTRVRANASRPRAETAEELRERLAKMRREIRRWQRRCEEADPDEEPGTQMKSSYAERLQEQLQETRQKLEKMDELGARQLSRTDPYRGFLHQADGFVLGYTADLAVSDDHLIVARRTTQTSSDSA